MNKISEPRILSDAEVKLIYTENFFRLQNSLNKMYKCKFLELGDQFYSDYKVVWNTEMRPMERQLRLESEKLVNGNTSKVFLDPTHENGDNVLQYILKKVSYFENVACYVKNKYDDFLYKYHPIRKDEEEDFDRLYNNVKMKYLKDITKSNGKSLSEDKLKSMFNDIEKLIDLENKVNVITGRLGRNLFISTEEKDKHIKYNNIYSKQIEELKLKIMSNFKQTKSKEEEWLFG